MKFNLSQIDISDLKVEDLEKEFDQFDKKQVKREERKKLNKITKHINK